MLRFIFWKVYGPFHRDVLNSSEVSFLSTATGFSTHSANGRKRIPKKGEETKNKHWHAQPGHTHMYFMFYRYTGLKKCTGNLHSLKRKKTQQKEWGKSCQIKWQKTKRKQSPPHTAWQKRSNRREGAFTRNTEEQKNTVTRGSFNMDVEQRDGTAGSEQDVVGNHSDCCCACGAGWSTSAANDGSLMSPDGSRQLLPQRHAEK